ncbi:MAG: hypothetical protein AAF593_00680 [Planctomycetota bacterium]
MPTTTTPDTNTPYEFPGSARPPVVGHTRPDVAEVVVELMKRTPDWNRRMAAAMRQTKRFSDDGA